ncbi:MAG: polyprenol monophosphomannose synthase [Verrucomicrobia bacterium]|nr:polyprenol monophosphomannose synthase [Verrucomicrobiota bacterium]
MKVLVIIPTYNERENILPIVKAVLSVTGPDVHVLVCDDNSPDQTAKLVEEFMAAESRLHLLVRREKQGLGPAYLAAFQWGLNQGYEVLVEMDADFSHRPEDLVKILETIPAADFVMGSRWIPGGQTLNWGLGRKIISRAGTQYAQMILGFPVSDFTGGFNAWTSRVLNSIDLPTVRSNGYSFQIELKYRALKRGFKSTEVPILFEDRRAGQSKMSTRIVLEAIYRVWLLKLKGNAEKLKS